MQRILRFCYVVVVSVFLSGGCSCPSHEQERLREWLDAVRAYESNRSDRNALVQLRKQHALLKATVDDNLVGVLIGFVAEHPSLEVRRCAIGVLSEVEIGKRRDETAGSVTAYSLGGGCISAETECS